MFWYDVKDELAEHHEGQAIFTKRRMFFAIGLGVVMASAIAWFILGGE